MRLRIPIYWVGIRIPVADGEQPRRLQTTLLAASPSLGGGGLFVDARPWLFVALVAVLLSALLWVPFVRGLTHSIGELTGATERIAEGQYDILVRAKRRDELGRLGHAVNRLAGRLGGFVTGQKRFLGDVAHELCSPLARLQMALGILEERAEERHRPCLEDLRTEAQEMSQLVNELLSLRNAIRYAADAGPITLTARVENEQVRISVADCGPGVPPESLSKLFDPFYRVDSSRTRQTGGAGLGLTIVRSCMEACGGQVTAHNRAGGGLEVSLYLPKAKVEVA